MSEDINNEETQVEETTASASEENKQEESAEESQEESNEESIDYKSELEKAQNQIGQAEHTIEKVKGENKDLKEEAEDKPNEEAIRKIIQEENLEFYKKTRKGDIQNKLKASTGSDDEYLLAKFHYDNSINVTGNDQNDIENAVFLANKKRFSSNISEAIASAQSKNFVSKHASGAGQKKAVERTETIALTPEEKQLQKGFGLTDEQMKGGYDRLEEKKKRQADANRQFSK